MEKRPECCAACASVGGRCAAGGTEAPLLIMTLKEDALQKLACVKELGRTGETDTLTADAVANADVLQTGELVPGVTGDDAPLTCGLVADIATDADVGHDGRGMQGVGAGGIGGDDGASGETGSVGEGRDAEVAEGDATGEGADLFFFCEDGERGTRGGEKTYVGVGGGRVEEEVSDGGGAVYEGESLAEVSAHVECGDCIERDRR